MRQDQALGVDESLGGISISQLLQLGVIMCDYLYNIHLGNGPYFTIYKIQARGIQYRSLRIYQFYQVIKHCQV